MKKRVLFFFVHPAKFHLSRATVNQLKADGHQVDVIITGRGCHRAIIELADTVSEVQSIKHAFDSGIKAQQGIDW